MIQKSEWLCVFYFQRKSLILSYLSAVQFNHWLPFQVTILKAAEYLQYDVWTCSRDVLVPDEDISHSLLMPRFTMETSFFFFYTLYYTLNTVKHIQNHLRSASKGLIVVSFWVILGFESVFMVALQVDDWCNQEDLWYPVFPSYISFRCCLSLPSSIGTPHTWCGYVPSVSLHVVLRTTLHPDFHIWLT